MSTAYYKIINYIDAHIKEEIRITDIANMVGYSQNHVYKLFAAYSSMPIMEYIRRKRLCYAANEMYTGRKLLSIALDYGFETPAGFYKAFKSVFGCSPREYKREKEGICMYIDNVKTVAELDEMFEFWPKIFPHLPIDHQGTREQWLERFNADPSMLLYAKASGQAMDGKLCGFALAAGPAGQYVNIEIDGVLPEYKDSGVHEALLIEVEKRARAGGYYGLVLGIIEGMEEFYAKLGFLGRTLVQSEKYSVDELLAFNANGEKYEVSHSGVWDGYVNQMWLNVPLMDKNLKRRYTEEIGDCWVQIIVNKEF